MRNLLWGVAALLWPITSPAQVVEYYHLDALGSVRAVSSQAGAVVERHDYLPFGEEHTPGLSCPAPGQPTDCQRRAFIAKERDSETGFDYFGARYYGAETGRFTTIDPVYTWRANLANPQRWNRYSYSLNSPLVYLDQDGRWPTKKWLPVHQASVDDALGKDVSAADREGLKEAVVRADDAQFQSGEGAHRHAMRGPHQDETQARAEANSFVRQELEQARFFEKHGAHESALAHVGNAMHALQDATSPAHEGFQLWRTEWNTVRSRDAQRHGRREIYPNAAEKARLDRATRDAWQYFKGEKDMPDDFFQE